MLKRAAPLGRDFWELGSGLGRWLRDDPPGQNLGVLVSFLDCRLDGLMALSNPTAMAATIGAAANHSQRDIDWDGQELQCRSM